MGKMDEQILVVPRKVVFGADNQTAFQGYKTKSEFGTPYDVEDIEIMRRGDMEENPRYKQLITYAILKDRESKKYLIYKRLSGSGEQRLVDKTSIGVGGHTNWHEAQSLNGLMYENFIRELDEELNIKGLKTSRPIGFINDDENEVGKVHLGVVYLVEVSASGVTVNETDTLAIDWLTLDEIKADEKLESWSRLLVESEDFIKEVTFEAVVEEEPTI